MTVLLAGAFGQGNPGDEALLAAFARALPGRRLVAASSDPAASDVVVAGPWAREGTPVVNPSYWSPRAYALLGLDELAASSRRMTDALTGSSLPPDWATVESWGVAASGPPGGGEPAYDYDAVRVPIRLAESCDPADRELAARLWPRLSSQPGAARRALDGTPLTGEESAAALAGSAAAAHAAGDAAGARGLLDRAAELDEAHPGYYGSALVALTRAMLESDALGRC